MAEDLDIQFYQLALSLQAAAMQQMGKIANPFSGKIERDLSLAKNSIDMLEMLERKTRGNLNNDEKKLVDHILFELRINYVDELKKDQESTAPKGSETAEAGSQTVNPTPADADNQERD